ncbi:MAG: hypothetical protein ABI224_01865 [Acetobacteraceae bacterium]
MSDNPWRVDALVRTEGRQAAFDFVTPHPNSETFAMAEFLDIARLENPPVRIAVVHRKASLGDLLTVVPMSRGWRRMMLQTRRSCGRWRRRPSPAAPGRGDLSRAAGEVKWEGVGLSLLTPSPAERERGWRRVARWCVERHLSRMAGEVGAHGAPGEGRASRLNETPSS